MPVEGIALDGISVLVLTPGGLSADQSDAIRRWVQRGGHLVVMIGSDAERFATGALPEWLPVAADSVYVERQTAALTSRITAFVPNTATLRTLEELSLSELQLKDGVVLVNGPTAPVITRSAYGLGQVTAVALDLDRRPFFRKADEAEAAEGSLGEALWDGLPRLCLLLAGQTATEAVQAGSPRQLRLSPTGVSDLQSQVAAILDHFPAVDRPSSWNVIGLLSVYLLLIGPIDYLLVHRLLRRPQLTWITLPAWVLLASWWSTAYAVQTNGDRVRLNQLETIDVAVDSGLVRAHSWFSLYSPEARRHSIQATPQWDSLGHAGNGEDHRPVRLSWLPRPEEGFRGMYRRGGLDLGGAGYRIEPEAGAVKGMPVEMWSSLGIIATAEREIPTQEEPPLAESRQVYNSRGELVSWNFRHRLPGDIIDWFAVHEAQVWFPMSGDQEALSIAPGESLDISRGLGQQLLRTYIQGEVPETEKTKTGTKTYVRSEEYDPLSFDARRLFRTLSFHEAVGGPGYTRLSNQTLGRLDLSDLSHLNRLVVFGRLERPAVQFEVDGKIVKPADRVTWVRLVVPVTREQGEESGDAS
jgi:hypothetical protein